MTPEDERLVAKGILGFPVGAILGLCECTFKRCFCCIEFEIETRSCLMKKVVTFWTRKKENRVGIGQFHFLGVFGCFVVKKTDPAVSLSKIDVTIICVCMCAAVMYDITFASMNVSVHMRLGLGFTFLVLIAVGFSTSTQVRCMAFLIIPVFMGKEGRTMLTAAVVQYLVKGIFSRILTQQFSHDQNKVYFAKDLTQPKKVDHSADRSPDTAFSDTCSLFRDDVLRCLCNSTTGFASDRNFGSEIDVLSSFRSSEQSSGKCRSFCGLRQLQQQSLFFNAATKI